MKDGKPHWLWRMVAGTYGLNGPSFFKFLTLAFKTNEMTDALLRQMKKDGLI